jgi:hypothetical protein
MCHVELSRKVQHATTKSAMHIFETRARWLMIVYDYSTNNKSTASAVLKGRACQPC